MGNSNILKTQLSKLSNLEELTKALVKYIEQRGFDGPRDQQFQFLFMDIKHELEGMQKYIPDEKSIKRAMVDTTQQVGFWITVLGKELQKEK